MTPYTIPVIACAGVLAAWSLRRAADPIRLYLRYVVVPVGESAVAAMIVIEMKRGVDDAAVTTLNTIIAELVAFWLAWSVVVALASIRSISGGWNPGGGGEVDPAPDDPGGPAVALAVTTFAVPSAPVLDPVWVDFYAAPSAPPEPVQR